MILKTLDYRQSRHDSGVYEEWHYFDNITSASHYFNEDSKETCVRCNFNTGDYVVIDIPCVAYLMSDSGKTIEKIYGVTKESLPDPETGEERVFPTMQDAVDSAKDAH
jgi:hypothetical protein